MFSPMAVAGPTDDLFVERIEGTRYGWLGAYFRRVGFVRELPGDQGTDRIFEAGAEIGQGRPSRSTTVDKRKSRLAARHRGARRGHFRRDQRGCYRGMDRPRRAPHRDAAAGVSPAAGREKPSAPECRRTLHHDPYACARPDQGAHTHVRIRVCVVALRERLYCNLENPAAPMNGLLIYTASGDSEGTLGGLVAQAQSGRFERLVEEALRPSSWCSNDPVCMESPGEGHFRPILRHATARSLA